jgi:hypothetical protein
MRRASGKARGVWCARVCLFCLSMAVGVLGALTATSASARESSPRRRLRPAQAQLMELASR